MTVISEWITSAADRTGDAVYLENAAGTGTLTYAGLRRRAQAWARSLDRAGVPAGAAVAVRGPDPLEYATALVAILAAGRVVVPPWHPHEMTEALREACEAGLPRAKQPTEFCLVQELPLGPTGKVARRRLRALATTA